MNTVEKVLKTISYSSMIMYHDCPRMYYFNYILGPRIYESTIYTIYGKLIHKYCQDILLQKISKSDALKNFERTWKKFCKLYNKKIDIKFNTNELQTAGLKIINNTQEAFEKQFGTSIAHKAEHNLYCSMDNYPQKFTGYIDLIIEQDPIIIVDFKIVSSAFMYRKYKDKYKDYQLTLYKHFLCKEKNIDIKNVKLFFCLLERNEKSKKPVQFLEVSCGQKKIKNALKILNNTLYNIDRKFFPPKRISCNLYGRECPFKTNGFCK